VLEPGVGVNNSFKVDLHCHTHFSDGKHDLSFLRTRALANGVSHLAITDHDCIDALIATQSDEGPELIPGVEISCALENIEVHVVGLCVNARDQGLTTLLTQQQASRKTRIVRIDEKLQLQGTQGLFETLTSAEAVAMTRSHVADFLVDREVCTNRKKAFKKYLNKGGKLFVPAEWCSMATAIDAIRSAGGIAVLAHPGRYPLKRTKLRRLIETFQILGGEALEASYPNIAPEMKLFLEKLGSDFSLYLSCGSDFHDAAARWTDVGKFPTLSLESEPRAVWRHPIWERYTGDNSKRCATFEYSSG